jgi:hypothetical protein
VVRRSLHRLILTSAVLPLVMLVGLRSAWAAYACRMDGEVRSACCCPKAKAKVPAGTAPRVEARCCCDVTIHEATQNPTAREPVRAGFDAPIVGVTVPAALLPRLVTTIDRVRPDSARPPPPLVASFLDKQAILR